VKVTRLRLTNYRGIETLEARLPRRGLCVLLGDNEVGKSSLVEAVDLLLNFPHDSRNQAVLAVKPVHRDVGAEIEIDAEAGDCSFTYRKRFHVAPRTELIVYAPQRENRTGREAHDRVRALLRTTVDLDLWRALRVPQGSIGEQPSLAAAPSLARALAEDAQRQTQAHADLLTAARREYERHFTPLGEPRRAFVDEGAELARRRAEVEGLEAAVAAVERDAERVADLESEAARAAAEEEAAAHAAAALAREQHESEVHAQALALAAAAAEAAEAALRRSESAVRLLREREAVLVQEREAEARAQSTAGAHAQARAVLAAAEQAHASAGTARDLVNRRRVRRAEQEKLSACRRAFADWQQVSAQLASAETLAAADVDELARLQAVRDEARARLAAQSAEVRLVAKVDLSVDVTTSDGSSQRHRLRSGERLERTAEQGLRLDLPAAALEVQASPGAAELAAAAAHADAALAAGLGRLRVDSVGAARERLSEQRERQRAARELADVLGRLLVEREPARFAAAIDRLAAAAAGDDGDDEPLDPDELAAADAACRAAASAWQAARRAEFDASGDALRAGAELAKVRARVAAIAAALATLAEAGTAVAAPAAAADQLQAAATGHARARQDLRALEARSVRAPAAIAADLARHQDQQHHARLAARSARDELTALTARLVVQGDEGLAERLGRAQAELQQAAHAFAAKERQAAAAKALYQALLRARDGCVQSFHDPIVRNVESLGRAVFGPSFRVTLDEHLRVASRTLDGVTVAFADLSLGAREQIAILVRLACAMAVAPSGGVPVWLDDALGQSDPQRLRAMGEALRLAGESCQVVLLTCSPERAHWPGARVVRLDPRRKGRDREAAG